MRVGEHVAAAQRPPRHRGRHGLDAAVTVEPVIGDMDGSEHRLRRSHALKRQHETGIRFAGADRPLTPWIGVVGERGEQRRPPAVVGVRHLPVRPCTRGPPGLDSEGVAAQRIGRSGRRAYDELVGVGFQSWGPERRKERAPLASTAVPHLADPRRPRRRSVPAARVPARRWSTPPCARSMREQVVSVRRCSRRRPADCHRRQPRAIARWRRCPRASTSLRWTVRDDGCRNGSSPTAAEKSTALPSGIQAGATDCVHGTMRQLADLPAGDVDQRERRGAPPR